MKKRTNLEKKIRFYRLLQLLGTFFPLLYVTFCDFVSKRNIQIPYWITAFILLSDFFFIVFCAIKLSFLKQE